MRVFFPILFFLIYSLSSQSQQIEFFKSSRLPAEPYGGVDEVQDLVNSQMNYPETEYENNVNGEVFVLLKIDSEGNIVSKKVMGDKNENFRKEALRISELIIWERNETRASQTLGEEKIKFTFSKKKFDKLVRKRGYSHIPPSSPVTYIPKQLDSIPEILGYKDLNEFVRKNIKYPSLALQQGISGVVKVKFIVEANGKVSNIKIAKAVGGGCNEETTRLLKETNWKPGMKNEKPVRTVYSYSLSFVHPGNTYR